MGVRKRRVASLADWERETVSGPSPGLLCVVRSHTHTAMN